MSGSETVKKLLALDIRLVEAVQLYQRKHNIASETEAFRILLNNALSDGRAPRIEPALSEVTPREREVLALIASGRTSDDISMSLGVSRNTINNYITSMMRKTATRTRSELISFAASRQMFEFNDEGLSSVDPDLSEREIACVQMAADGKISEEIADELSLSVHTVNAYLGSATIKAGCVNRIQLIAYCIVKKIIRGPY